MGEAIREYDNRELAVPRRQRNPYESRNINVKPKQPKNESKKSQISAVEKNKTIAAIVMVGIISVGLVLFAVYTSAVAFETEKIKQENAVLQGEIDYLIVQLESENNVKKIENYALGELGMVYPEDNQRIRLTGESEPLVEAAEK